MASDSTNWLHPSMIHRHRRFSAAWVAAAAALLVLPVRPALAHPHVFITARAEIVFNEAGSVAAIRHIWQFDEAFSAYAMQGLDANNDGVITATELQPLAQINVESLNEYGFFTWLDIGGIPIAFEFPSEYWLDVYDSRLTLFYTLPLTTPAPTTGEIVLEVTDPEYFVAFTFDDQTPIRLVDAPESCVANYLPPEGLDDETAAQLAMIPADQRALPDGLGNVTADVANIIRVGC